MDPDEVDEQFAEIAEQLNEPSWMRVAVTFVGLATFALGGIVVWGVFAHLAAKLFWVGWTLIG